MHNFQFSTLNSEAFQADDLIHQGRVPVLVVLDFDVVFVFRLLTSLSLRVDLAVGLFRRLVSTNVDPGAVEDQVPRQPSEPLRHLVRELLLAAAAVAFAVASTCFSYYQPFPPFGAGGTRAHGRLAHGVAQQSFKGGWEGTLLPLWWFRRQQLHNVVLNTADRYLEKKEQK